MERRKLRKLRRLQFISFNLIILFLLMTTYVLFYFGISLKSILLFWGTISISGIMFDKIIKIKYPVSYYLFPFMKEIVDYEHQKIGNKREKIKWSNIIGILIFPLILFIQAFTIKTNINHTSRILKNLVFGSVLIIFLFNIDLILHIKKIDKPN